MYVQSWVQTLKVVDSREHYFSDATQNQKEKT